MNAFRTLIAAAGFALGSQTSAYASLCDGSFESPPAPLGGFTTLPSGTVFPSGTQCWTVVGAGNVAIVSGSAVANGISYVASAGSQWLDLTGNGSNSLTGVEQTATTTVGQSYKLTFRVGAITTPSSIGVYINGVQVMVATNNNTGGSVFNWKKFSIGFVANQPSTTIKFMNLDASTDHENGLDKVALAP